MPPLVQLIIQELPNGIALIQAAFAKAHPGAPVPSSDEIVAAYEHAFTDSIAKDEMIKALGALRPPPGV